MAKQRRKSGNASAAGAAGGAASTPRVPPRSRAASWRGAAMLIAIGAVLAASWLAWRQWQPASAPAAPKASAPARFVGSKACASCHAAEHEVWRGSQHARAMQEASPQTMLGDFNDVTFRHGGVAHRFFRRDEKFLVRTDGPDGKLTEFEIRHAFGVEPLQQYLIDLPGGRLQALGIAWDTERRRWFHLYPSERIDHRDELHWTARQQNWNFMCADCHSVDVRKNYDAATDAFKTTWAEISVGCEACHGPGSAHLEWARDRKGDPAKGLTAALDERRGARWAIDAKTGSAVRSMPRDSAREIEVCAQCHSRRAQFSEGYHAGKPFLDYYQPSLLTAPLYHADGQQRDEVYTWGSFLQSRMHAQGVTCADCHEPHGGRLRAGTPDATCLTCHAADRFAARAHHLHASDSKGASCVACHMPATTYMVVDPRRDHSFRVPRPDLTAALGTPNACNGCHADKTPRWAAEAIEAVHGKTRKGTQRFAEALDAGRRNHPAAGGMLVTLAGDPAAPGIARATALRELVQYGSREAYASIESGARSAEALLRMAALDAVAGYPPEARVRIAAPLLEDPVRAVRMAAGLALADVADAMLPAPRLAAARSAALEEYLAAQRYSAERPESRLNLGLLAMRRGDAGAAEKRYREALVLAPDFAPAYVNLADLLRAQGREEEGERVLRAGLSRAPRSAELHHALGLLHVRRQRYDAGLAALAQAARLAPENARYQYVHAVALHDRGKPREAVKVLEAALRRNPVDRDVLIALAQYQAGLGRREEALAHARKLAELAPDDQGLRQLLAQIEQSGAR
jgi:tetratricopeptide (TPR) repeat protein/formate-dependent nitrite reductase cytochrome c552 subunit